MDLDHAPTKGCLSVVDASGLHGDACGEKQMRIPNNGPKKILMVVHCAGPLLGEAAVCFKEAIPVLVEQFGGLVFLRHKNAPVVHREPHRLRKSLRNPAE